MNSFMLVSATLLGCSGSSQIDPLVNSIRDSHAAAHGPGVADSSARWRRSCTAGRERPVDLSALSRSSTESEGLAGAKIAIQVLARNPCSPTRDRRHVAQRGGAAGT